MDPQEQPKEQDSAPKQERVPIKSLRTYQGDVEEAMAKNRSSTTTVFVAEQKRKLEKPTLYAPPKPANPEVRNKFFTILGISLLALGIIIVSAVYYVRSHQEVIIAQQTKTILDFTKETDIAVASSTRSGLVSRLITEKNSFKQPVNSILYLNTINNSEKPQDIASITGLLGPTMPPILTRALGKDYMLGVVSYDTNALFIILKIADYPSAYAGMLKWENTMINDLGGLFEIPQPTSGTGAFTDEAIRNKDLRIITGADGKTALLYSFIDKNTLVITKNEDIFDAILAKYLTSQNTR